MLTAWFQHLFLSCVAMISRLSTDYVFRLGDQSALTKAPGETLWHLTSISSLVSEKSRTVRNTRAINDRLQKAACTEGQECFPLLLPCDCYELVVSSLS